MTMTALAPASPGQRLPASVVGSLGVHAGILMMLLYSARMSKETTTHVISNVDLMIQVHKTVGLPKAIRPKEPLSMTSFLKMALPTMPRVAMPQRLSVPLPEHRAMMQVQPKLQDRGRLNAEPKLVDAIDLNAHQVKMADISARLDTHHVAELAALPRLEEVGVHRVKNLPAAIALDERRQQAAALQGLGAVSALPQSHHGVAPMGQALEDAGAAPSSGNSFASKIASMLPKDTGMDMGRRSAPIGIQNKIEAAPIKRRAAQAMDTGGKKGVTIEGPLQDRKVVSYEIPEFPKWARDQGVLEANVSIRFWVDKNGDVLDNMRIEHTSGYGQLDRLAMDSLKNWKFAPLLGDQRQWGVITFRFVLE